MADIAVRLRIEFIDDNAEVCQAAAAALVERRYEALRFTDAMSALDAACGLVVRRR